MSRTVVLLILLTGAVSACVVSVNEYQCDAAHSCAATEQCIQGSCEPRGPPPPPRDGGVVWNQSTDGFSSSSMTCDAGCSLSVDPSMGNALTAMVTKDAAGNSRAAEVLTASSLPVGAQGKARGRVILPAGFARAASVVFFHLEDGASKVIVELSVNDAQQLEVHSDPAALGGSTESSAPAAPLFTAGAERVVEVSWRQGSFRLVTVDGQPAFLDTLGFSDGNGGNTLPADAVPHLARFGIDGYGTADFQSVSIRLAEWQLADDPTATLTP